jgi:hypothetical protein
MDRYELADVMDYATWSGIVELLSLANRAYEAVPFNTDARERERAADELRTIARLLEAAATEVRGDELDALRRAA